MKRLFLMTLLLCVAIVQAQAENYPYRSDYLFVTVPDHNDWLYQSGENATIDILFLKYGMPVDAEVTYEIADDEMKADHSGRLTLKAGRGKINIGTRKKPGFRDLRLVARVGDAQY